MTSSSPTSTPIPGVAAATIPGTASSLFRRVVFPSVVIEASPQLKVGDNLRSSENPENGVITILVPENPRIWNSGPVSTGEEVTRKKYAWPKVASQWNDQANQAHLRPMYLIPPGVIYDSTLLWNGIDGIKMDEAAYWLKRNFAIGPIPRWELPLPVIGGCVVIFSLLGRGSKGDRLVHIEEILFVRTQPPATPIRITELNPLYDTPLKLDTLRIAGATSDGEVAFFIHSFYAHGAITASNNNTIITLPASIGVGGEFPDRYYRIEWGQHVKKILDDTPAAKEKLRVEFYSPLYRIEAAAPRVGDPIKAEELKKQIEDDEARDRAVVKTDAYKQLGVREGPVDNDVVMRALLDPNNKEHQVTIYGRFAIHGSYAGATLNPYLWPVLAWIKVDVIQSLREDIVIDWGGQPEAIAEATIDRACKENNCVLVDRAEALRQAKNWLRVDENLPPKTNLVLKVRRADQPADGPVFGIEFVPRIREQCLRCFKKFFADENQLGACKFHTPPTGAPNDDILRSGAVRPLFGMNPLYMGGHMMDDTMLRPGRDSRLYKRLDNLESAYTEEERIINNKIVHPGYPVHACCNQPVYMTREEEEKLVAGLGCWSGRHVTSKAHVAPAPAWFVVDDKGTVSVDPALAAWDLSPYTSLYVLSQIINDATRRTPVGLQRAIELEFLYNLSIGFELEPSVFEQPIQYFAAKRAGFPGPVPWRRLTGSDANNFQIPVEISGDYVQKVDKALQRLRGHAFLQKLEIEKYRAPPPEIPTIPVPVPVPVLVPVPTPTQAELEELRRAQKKEGKRAMLVELGNVSISFDNVLKELSSGLPAQTLEHIKISNLVKADAVVDKFDSTMNTLLGIVAEGEKMTAVFDKLTTDRYRDDKELKKALQDVSARAQIIRAQIQTVKDDVRVAIARNQKYADAQALILNIEEALRTTRNNHALFIPENKEVAASIEEADNALKATIVEQNVDKALPRLRATDKKLDQVNKVAVPMAIAAKKRAILAKLAEQTKSVGASLTSLYSLSGTTTAVCERSSAKQAEIEEAVRVFYREADLLLAKIAGTAKPLFASIGLTDIWLAQESEVKKAKEDFEALLRDVKNKAEEMKVHIEDIAKRAKELAATREGKGAAMVAKAMADVEQFFGEQKNDYAKIGELYNNVHRLITSNPDKYDEAYRNVQQIENIVSASNQKWKKDVASQADFLMSPEAQKMLKDPSSPTSASIISLGKLRQDIQDLQRRAENVARAAVICTMGMFHVAHDADMKRFAVLQTALEKSIAAALSAPGQQPSSMFGTAISYLASYLTTAPDADVPQEILNAVKAALAHRIEEIPYVIRVASLLSAQPTGVPTVEVVDPEYSAAKKLFEESILRDGYWTKDAQRWASDYKDKVAEIYNIGQNFVQQSTLGLQERVTEQMSSVDNLYRTTLGKVQGELKERIGKVKQEIELCRSALKNLSDRRDIVEMIEADIQQRYIATLEEFDIRNDELWSKVADQALLDSLRKAVDKASLKKWKSEYAALREDIERCQDLHNKVFCDLGDGKAIEAMGKRAADDLGSKYEIANNLVKALMVDIVGERKQDVPLALSNYKAACDNLRSALDYYSDGLKIITTDNLKPGHVFEPLLRLDESTAIARECRQDVESKVRTITLNYKTPLDAEAGKCEKLRAAMNAALAKLEEERKAWRKGMNEWRLNYEKLKSDTAATKATISAENLKIFVLDDGKGMDVLKNFESVSGTTDTVFKDYFNLTTPPSDVVDIRVANLFRDVFNNFRKDMAKAYAQICNKISASLLNESNAALRTLQPIAKDLPDFQAFDCALKKFKTQDCAEMAESIFRDSFNPLADAWRAYLRRTEEANELRASLDRLKTGVEEINSGLDKLPARIDGLNRRIVPLRAFTEGRSAIVRDLISKAMDVYKGYAANPIPDIVKKGEILRDVTARLDGAEKEIAQLEGEMTAAAALPATVKQEANASSKKSNDTALRQSTQFRTPRIALRPIGPADLRILETNNTNIQSTRRQRSLAPTTTAATTTTTPVTPFRRGMPPPPPPPPPAAPAPLPPVETITTTRPTITTTSSPPPPPPPPPISPPPSQRYVYFNTPERIPVVFPTNIKVEKAAEQSKFEIAMEQSKLEVATAAGKNLMKDTIGTWWNPQFAPWTLKENGESNVFIHNQIYSDIDPQTAVITPPDTLENHLIAHPDSHDKQVWVYNTVIYNNEHLDHFSKITLLPRTANPSVQMYAALVMLTTKAKNGTEAKRVYPFVVKRLDADQTAANLRAVLFCWTTDDTASVAGFLKSLNVFDAGHKSPEGVPDLLKYFRNVEIHTNPITRLFVNLNNVIPVFEQSQILAAAWLPALVLGARIYGKEMRPVDHTKDDTTNEIKGDILAAYEQARQVLTALNIAYTLRKPGELALYARQKRKKKAI